MSELESITELSQGSIEWHEFRRCHIGASDCPIIMNISPWKTPYSLWEEKCGLVKSNFISDAMNRGINLESLARFEYENMVGFDVPACVRKHKSIDYMIASMDGFNSSLKKGVEIKCPGKTDHLKALNGLIPEKYYPQLQHQIEVCDLDEIDYFSFDGEVGVIVKCLRDEDYIKQILLQEEKFWYCVQNFISPKIFNGVMKNGRN